MDLILNISAIPKHLLEKSIRLRQMTCQLDVVQSALQFPFAHTPKKHRLEQKYKRILRTYKQNIVQLIYDIEVHQNCEIVASLELESLRNQLIKIAEGI